MAKRIKHSAIPRGNDKQAVASLTSIAETLIGAKGDKLEKAVTFRDLESLDIIEIKRSLNGREIFLENPTPDPNVVIEFPTQPTGFTLVNGFTSILLSWDFPQYLGHAFTEIYRAEDNVLGNASRLISSNGVSFSDIPGNNFSGYYWIRHVNQNGDEGPYHATSGLLGETAEDIEFNLSVLNGRLEQIHFASFLSDRIDLIQVNADAVGALDILVDNNKIAADNAINTINNVTIPGINQQIADINNLFPGYATLSYVDSTFFNSTQVDSAISGRLDTFLAQVIQPDYVSQAFLTSSYRTEANTDSAISQSISNFLTNTITPNYVTTAFLETNYITESSTDNAISQALSDFLALTISPLYTTTAFLQSNYRTETNTDNAIASALTSFLTTTIAPTYVTSAFITNNYRTETDTDSAIATEVTGLRGEIFDGNGTILQSAFVSNLDTAISNAGGSIATSLSNLSATLNDPTTGLAATAATVTSNQQAIVNDTGRIISSKIDTYSVTANSQTNTLSEWSQVAADANDNFNAQWGVKTTVNGLTGGVGFYNDGTTTQFTVDTERFAVIDSTDNSVKSMFATITNDPVLPDGVYVDTAFIKVATIAELVVGDVIADKVVANIDIISPKIVGGTVRAVNFEMLGSNFMEVKESTPFGPDNLYIWAGVPILDGNGDPDLAQLRKTNAEYYRDANGGYSGWDIKLDILRASAGNPAFGLNQTIQLLDIGTGGNSKQVSARFTLSSFQVATSNPGTLSPPQATVTVQARKSTGGWFNIISATTLQGSVIVEPDFENNTWEITEGLLIPLTTTFTDTDTDPVDYQAIVTNESRNLGVNFIDNHLISLEVTENP